jgi:hypothetical protein
VSSAHATRPSSTGRRRYAVCQMLTDSSLTPLTLCCRLWQWLPYNYQAVKLAPLHSAYCSFNTYPVDSELHELIDTSFVVIGLDIHCITEICAALQSAWYVTLICSQFWHIWLCKTRSVSFVPAAA